MEYSVIAIGDELLIGQVTDTNSGWIARRLTPAGWRQRSVRVIGDSAASIRGALEASLAEADVVLMTGGLGPTRDDITKQVLCDYFGGELRLDEAVARNVEAIFAKRGLTMNAPTASQAMVPTSCRVIQNRVGTAPIMWFERDGKVVVSMPGVPFEMQSAMDDSVVAELLRRFPSQVAIEHRTLVVAGVAESALSLRLEEFEDSLPAEVHLAYLPDQGLIRLRLSGESPDRAWLTATMERLVGKLDELLGDAIVSHADVPLSQILGELLAERGLTLATAESCTGGNIAHEITAIAGSSRYFAGGVVAYSNAVKRGVLGVDGDVLEAHGAVSGPVVEAMARGARRRLGTDCAIATSGIAGPGGAVPGKPVGTVWIAASVGEKLEAECYHFPGSRERVIYRATLTAMVMLIRLLRSEP